MRTQISDLLILLFIVTVVYPSVYSQNPLTVCSSSFNPTASSSSFFTTVNDERPEIPTPAANTYTLFSQSPWPLGITSSQSADASSHRSSPFGSSNSGSLRATPDPFTSDERAGITSGGPYGTRIPGGVSGNGPWKTGTAANIDNSGAGQRTTSNDVDGGLLANMQSLWTSGPSPLQKLLDQQKQLRQLNPR